MHMRKRWFWLAAIAALTMPIGATSGELTAIVDDFRDAARLENLRECRSAEGEISPAGRSTLAPAVDDDLRVLLHCEDRFQANLLYTHFAGMTTNTVTSLDNAVLIDEPKIEPADGRQGKAFYLKGGRIQVPLPGLYAEDIRTKGYSYALWIKPDALDQDSVLAASTVAGIQLLVHDKRLILSYHTEGGGRQQVAGSTEIALGAWHHVAAVYDPHLRTARLYLDGKLDGVSKPWKPLVQGEVAVCETFGGLGNTDRGSFRGVVDEVAVTTRPLSDDQVRDLAEGACATGGFQSKPIDMGGTFNALRLSVDESAPGASQVFVWQNEKWHRIYPGIDLVCDMPGRMPLSSLKYKVAFAGSTRLRRLTFAWQKKEYTPAASKFSFLVMGDSHLGPMPQVIQWAYQKHPDLALIAGTGDVAGVPLFHASYKRQWAENPNAHPGLLPWYLAPGNHDIEYPTFVDYFVRRLGPAAPLSLPGMRNFREGPYDTYPDHGNYQDRLLQYSFDYLNAHFVILNIYYHDLLLPDDPKGKTTRNRMAGLNGKPKPYAPIGSVNEDMLRWLQEDLSSTKATFKFLVFHEGAYPVPGGGHNGDSLDNPHYPGNNGPNDTRPMRDKFWSVLAANGVTATFVGHNHHSAQTWAADPAGKAPAVYEFEGGGVMVVKNPIVVSIDENLATLRQYTTSPGKLDFREKWDPVIFNKNPDVPNYPVKLMQFDASGEDYRPTERTAYKVEVGTEMTGVRALYFEGRDNNLDDRILFTFKNLPPFLKVDDQSAKFRRAVIASEEVGASAIGQHPWTVTVSDGKTSASSEILLSVVPSERPVILGSVIPDGATLATWQAPEVSFLCQDNADLDLYTEYPTVKVNGQVLEGSGKPFGDRSFGWWRSYNYQDRVKSVSFNSPVRMPGDYEITMACYDRAGNRSDPYTLRFKIVDDGKRPEQAVPYVMGCWPRDGATVPALPAVRVWFASPIGDTNQLLKNTEISLTRDGRPADIVARTTIQRGVALALSPNAEAGVYALTVVPKTTLRGQPVTGKTFTARIELRP